MTMGCESKHWQVFVVWLQYEFATTLLHESLQWSPIWKPRAASETVTKVNFKNYLVLMESTSWCLVISNESFLQMKHMYSCRKTGKLSIQLFFFFLFVIFFRPVSLLGVRRWWRWKALLSLMQSPFSKQPTASRMYCFQAKAILSFS